MMWIKSINPSGYDWMVYYGDETDYLKLNTTYATADGAFAWNDTAPTSSVFSLGNGGIVNGSSKKFVAYLFATLAGVSKVGSYSGTSNTQNIDCGFSNGAKFLLIKRTDAAGGWYIFDSVRGINANSDSPNTDPYLFLDSTAAQATSDDYLSPYSSGFTINSGGSPINESYGGSVSYIFYAIAA